MKSVLRFALFTTLFAATKLFAAEETNAVIDEPKGSAPSYSMKPDTNAPTPELLEWQKEFGPTHDQRMEWWRAARFGMFIHWGVYSVPAGVWQGKPVTASGAEWIMNRGRIPVADYQNF